MLHLANCVCVQRCLYSGIYFVVLFIDWLQQVHVVEPVITDLFAVASSAALSLGFNERH